LSVDGNANLFYLGKDTLIARLSHILELLKIERSFRHNLKRTVIIAANLFLQLIAANYYLLG
jgi:hypothetical protein